ncbi:cholesterol esterase, partial [Nowakowskiella sp. JEL0078]
KISLNPPKGLSLLSLPLSVASMVTSQGFKTITKYVSPSIAFSLLGSKSVLSTVTSMQNLLPYYMQVLGVQTTLKLFFDWNCDHFGSSSRKIALFSHLYSSASVKNFVHWLQIKNEGEFREYDKRNSESTVKYLSQYFSSNARNDQPLKIPTNQIKNKVLVFCGKDSNFMWKHTDEHFPPQSKFIEIEEFESLDFLWSEIASEK